MKRYEMRSTITLTALGIELPAVGAHPNRLPFRGILTRVDEPSDKPPGGAQGHRVLLPRAVAERALPSLLTMGVNVAPDFTDHNERLKIGLFTAADIHGQDLVVSGVLYAKDFPKEVAFIQANKQALGLSFEITDVQVEDITAEIWTLAHVMFTGAAILWKDTAAYRSTALAAAQEKEIPMTVAEKLKAQREAAQQKLAELRTLNNDIAAMEAEEATAVGSGDQAAMSPEVLMKSMESMMKTMMEAAMNPLMERLKSMESTMMPGMKKKDEHAEMDEHDDEDQDKAMLKRILERVDSMATAADQQKATEAKATEETKAAGVKAFGERLASIEAALKAIGMHTDKTAGMNGLHTDTNSQASNTLLTDETRTAGGHPSHGGPQRRTVTATQAPSAFVAKYVDTTQQWTEDKLDSVLKDKVTDPATRIAIKHELAALGILQ